jgi:hypothetical protein
VIHGTRYGATKDDPVFLPLVAGNLDGGLRYLRVTRPKYEKYLKQWTVSYMAYCELDPCECCGQPRGAGSLHD